MTPTTPDLPTFPGTRTPHCPFDPPPEHADWRAGEGLRRAVWKGAPVWVVTRYEDIRAAMGDPRLSADNHRPDFPAATPPPAHQPQAFPRMDDPEHARLRRMLTRDFTVKRVEAMRPEIRRTVDGFLDEMIAKGRPAELVHDFALPIPSLVISLMLGVPYEEHEFFQTHTGTLVDATATAEARQGANIALFLYLLDLVERKEREPGDDIVSRLVHDQVAAGELTKDFVAMNAMTLLIAGHETTANMIALGTLALLQNPGQLARVRDTDDPALIASGVEELLRYLTIAQDMVARVATEDVVIGGQLVRAGEGLIMSLPAGNRDAAFAADPDTVDVGRNARGHLAFGYGVHQCLGQALARAELQVALPALLRRLPGLRLAVPLEEIVFRTDMSTYGVHALPVTW